VIDGSRRRATGERGVDPHRWLKQCAWRRAGQIERDNFEDPQDPFFNALDDVMNSQRRRSKRSARADGDEDVSDTIAGMRATGRRPVTRKIRKRLCEQWKIARVKDECSAMFGSTCGRAWAKKKASRRGDQGRGERCRRGMFIAQRRRKHGTDVWAGRKERQMAAFERERGGGDEGSMQHLDHLRQASACGLTMARRIVNRDKREAFNLLNDRLSGCASRWYLMGHLQLRMEPPPMPGRPAQMQEIHEDTALHPDSDDPAFDPGRSGARRRNAAAVTHGGRARPQRSLDLGQVARNAPAHAARAKRSSSNATAGF